MLSDREASNSKKKNYFFETNSVAQLVQGYKGYDYSLVKRWTKNVSVFDISKLFFPVNTDGIHWVCTDGIHWVCVVIAFEKKRIQAYNSSAEPRQNLCDMLFQYLMDEGKTRKHDVVLNKDECSIGARHRSIPIQTNVYDFGLFTCIFAYLLSMDRTLSFNQNDIDACRSSMKAAIETRDLAVMEDWFLKKHTRTLSITRKRKPSF